MNLEKVIREIIKIIKENDPVYGCKVYKDLGCSHVDGLLCDFPNCSINNKYNGDYIERWMMCLKNQNK